MIARWSGPPSGEPTSGFGGFVARNKRAIQWGAVALGLLFILLGPEPNALLVVITTLVVLVVVVLAQVIAGPTTSGAEQADTMNIPGDVVIEEDLVVRVDEGTAQ
jgi:hypothetical protein